MQSTKKEHDKKDLRKYDPATQHIHNHTIKPRLELHNWLGLALNIIEEGHEGCEGICHCIRMTLIQCHKQLKLFSMIQPPLVVKQEAKGAVFDCHVDQTLPEITGLQIGCIGDEERV